MIKDTICIDPGVGGGIAINYGKRVFVINMPEMPPKCTSKVFTEMQVKLIKELAGVFPVRDHKVWIEQVGPRPSDTPKTAWRFSANYHCLLMALEYRKGLGYKTQLPAHWQAQLGIELPSGQHNYDRRKKLLKDFATEKFPEVQRISKNKKGKWTKTKAKPTTKTADALCMLWVNGGFE